MINMDQEQNSAVLTPEQEAFTKKWSWGAFAMPNIYFFVSGLMKEGIYSLIPFLNIYIWVKGIFRGRRMSWERGEWKNWDVYVKRQKIVDKIGIVVLAVAAVILIPAIVLPFYFTQPAVRSANMFFEDIAAGQVEKAYNEATPGFRELGPLDEFEQFINENSYMKRYAESSFSSRSFSGGIATLTGKITTQEGEKYPVEVDLQKIDGVWRVDGFEFR